MGRVVEALAAAEIAHNGATGINTDPGEAEFESANIHFGNKFVADAAHLKRARDSPLSMITLINGCVKYPDNRVTDDFVDSATLLYDRPAHGIKVFVQGRYEELRACALGKSGEACDIGK